MCQICVTSITPTLSIHVFQIFSSDLRLSLAIFPDVLQTAATDESELALKMEPLCQPFYRHNLLFTPHVILSAVST